MSIEKRLYTCLALASDFDPRAKFAHFSPSIYIPQEIQEFSEVVRPDPRYCYMHTIAMGGGLTWGSNLNGDVFREEELCGIQDPEEAAKNIDHLAGICVPRYKTFETVKFFHHHANDIDRGDPWFGDVPLAAWNDEMRRVELIIRIWRSRDPETAQRIDRGDTVPVSMGCRIHHEKCSYCGNENEFTSQRCIHLARMMNEIMPGGLRVQADNFKPRMIDISKVTIPAEPTALSLGKVAEYGLETSTHPYAVIFPANEAVDIVDEKSAAWRQKWSAIDKQIGGSSINDLRQSNTPAEVGNESGSFQEFSPDELSSMLDECDGDIDCVISTLASSGVVLSPIELTTLTMTATNRCDPECIEKDAELVTPLRASLDNFSASLYHAHLTKIAARTGYSADARLSTPQEWDALKLAASGVPEEIVDLYSFYRRLIGSLPLDGFKKSAHLNPALRTLVADNGIPDAERVNAAMYYLAFAGIATT